MTVSRKTRTWLWGCANLANKTNMTNKPNKPNTTNWANYQVMTLCRKKSPMDDLGNREIPKRTPGQPLLPPHINIRLHSTKSLRIVGECWVFEKCFGFHLVWNPSIWNDQKYCLLYDRVRFPSTDLQSEWGFSPLLTSSFAHFNSACLERVSDSWQYLD